MRIRTLTNIFFSLIIIFVVQSSCNKRTLPLSDKYSKAFLNESSFFCLKLQIDSFYNSGFNYSITNRCDNKILLIKDLNVELFFSQESNFQNPKISYKPLIPNIKWKGKKSKKQYFKNVNNCGEIVDSLAPYYVLKKGETIYKRFDFVENNFQPLIQGKSYNGFFSLSVPDEYRELCPKLFIGSIQVQFFCKL